MFVTGSGLAPLVAAVVGVAVDPAAVAETSRPVRAVGSFAAVSLLGGVAVYLYGGFVDRAVDSSTGQPLHALVYGVVLHGVVGLGAVYAFTQLLSAARAAGGGGGGQLPVTVAATAAVVVWAAVAAVGLTVVGTALVEQSGRDDRPEFGVLLGAAVAAVVWIALPFVPALLVLVVVVSFGIGGPTKQWVHASREPAVDAGPDA
jgi:hypothetical protein